MRSEGQSTRAAPLEVCATEAATTLESATITLGAQVAVFRLLPTPYIEGFATVDEAAIGDHCFIVRFIGDPTPRRRFVHPDWQVDPARSLLLLQQLWRAETALSEITDFFPDETS